MYALYTLVCSAPSLSVVIDKNGIATEGRSFSLTCMHSLENMLTMSSTTRQWFNGSVLKSTTDRIIFNPVTRFDNQKTFVCRVTVRTPGWDGTITSSNRTSFTVRGVFN